MEFFKKIGFLFKEGNTATSAAMYVGTKKVVVMLFDEAPFKKAAGNELADTSKGTEVLMSFDAESRDEVDGIAIKVADAGGTIFARPAEIQGWMYGCGFIDPDGHRWNALYMDMGKMK